jgi:inhibitor of KinA sporulation pathway (predicted exonuclease)
MFAIIDLEWTSWKNSIQRNWSFCWEKKEIIQIGAIKFNNKNYIKKKNLIVRPKINQNLSCYVQKLTGISQFKINTTSTTFEKAIFEINIFYNNIDIIYCNGLDKEILIENCKINNLIQPKFIKKIKNISLRISDKLGEKNKHFESGNLNDKIGLKKLKKHNALNDCENIMNFIKKFNIY